MYTKFEFSDCTAKLMKKEKPVIATISSNEAAAITSDGIPFFTPNPSCCKSNIPTTTNAGDTAAKMKPNDNPGRSV